MAGLELDPATVGEDASYLITLCDSDGNPVAGLTGSEPLSGSVWAGESTAALFAPTCTWSDAPNAVVSVAIAGTQTATLDPGLYAFLLRITLAGKTSDAARGSLRLLPAPGTAVARPTYSSFQRMLNRAPWLARLQKTEAGLSGFLDQRADAREWLDGCIKRHWRGGTMAPAIWPNQFLGGVTGVFRTGGDDPYLVGLLATDKLMVTPEVEEVVTLHAIGLVARAQIAPGESDYAEMADKFLGMAEDRLAMLKAQIDLNGSGYPAFVIDLGTTDTLRG